MSTLLKIDFAPHGKVIYLSLLCTEKIMLVGHSIMSNHSPVRQWSNGKRDGTLTRVTIHSVLGSK